MNFDVVAVCFPVIFIGELPDKTMFANLVLATRGHPGRVWVGAAGAFTVHAALAVTVGVALFEVVPKRALDVVVAALFAGSAVYAWLEATKDEADLALKKTTRHGAIVTSFVVIFLAEWGDLTQVLTADLAAKYHAGLEVALAAVMALWAAAAVAVLGGQALSRFVSVATIRKLTAVLLVVLAGATLWTALA